MYRARGLLVQLPADGKVESLVNQVINVVQVKRISSRQLASDHVVYQVT